jgi:MFS family permease
MYVHRDPHAAFTDSYLDFSRFFGGVGVGMITALVPSYVSECAPKMIRGRCTGMIQLSNNLGIMLACESSTSTYPAVAS